MSEENKEVAKAFLITGGRGDMAAFAATLCDDVVVHTMGEAVVSGKRGRDEVISLVGMLDRFTTEPIVFEFLTVTAEDDRVAVECRSHSRLIDGRPYENSYHCLFWIRDGRVARMHEYVDTKYTDEVFVPLLAQASD